jgi:hypothetical protein
MNHQEVAYMTPEEEDDIPTMIPGRGTSRVAAEVLTRQRVKMEMIGHYVAASLDTEFKGPEFVIEGTCEVHVTIRDRRTGMEIGGAKLPIPITFASEHRK